MRKFIYTLLAISLSIGFASCGDDEKEDEHISALKIELETLKDLIQETEKEISEKEIYCAAFPSNREQLACHAEWITPLNKRLSGYIERKEEIEKKLGIN